MRTVKLFVRKVFDVFITVVNVLGFILALLFCILAIFCLLFIRPNDKSVVVTKYSCTSDKIENQIKIVQISDLHDFDNVEEVVARVKEECPDIVVTTGDMFDGNRPDIRNTLLLYEGISDLGVPVYYISGNHEGTKPELLALLKDQLTNLGVVVLSDNIDSIHINNNPVNIIGLSKQTKYSKKIRDIDVPLDVLNIVLCHYPEDFDKLLSDEELYYGQELDWDMDFLFTGHAHGGQIRIFNKGIYSPSQGLFPKYSHGIYVLTETETMIVNSGLGNSTFPIRINNQPEIVSIVISPKQ